MDFKYDLYETHGYENSYAMVKRTSGPWPDDDTLKQIVGAPVNAWVGDFADENYKDVKWPTA